jgi:hypothetical protein
MEHNISQPSCDTLNKSINYHDGINLCIYFTHCKLNNELITLLKRGTCIRVNSVLPVYLWGELYGFATTVRSNVIIISTSNNDINGNNNDISNNNNNTNNNDINGNDIYTITNSSSSSSSSYNNDPTESLLKTSCYIYIAWRSYILAKLTLILSNSVLSNTKGQTHKIWKYLHESINVTSSVSKTNHIIDINDINNINNSETNNNKIVINHLFKISSIIIEETNISFSDTNLNRSYYISAGHDCDYLLSKIPNILSLGNYKNIIDNNDKKRQALTIGSEYWITDIVHGSCFFNGTFKTQHFFYSFYIYIYLYFLFILYFFIN